jgi:hypothetical protein
MRQRYIEQLAIHAVINHWPRRPGRIVDNGAILRLTFVVTRGTPFEPNTELKIFLDHLFAPFRAGAMPLACRSIALARAWIVA